MAALCSQTGAGAIGQQLDGTSPADSIPRFTEASALLDGQHGRMTTSKQIRLQRYVMIGVPTHGIYFGYSMPPTLPKSPQIEYIYKNIYFKIFEISK